MFEFDASLWFEKRCERFRQESQRAEERMLEMSRNTSKLQEERDLLGLKVLQEENLVAQFHLHDMMNV